MDLGDDLWSYDRSIDDFSPDQVDDELIISNQVEGMEEDEQDQEVPEAPSPLDEDEEGEEAGNEQEVGGNLSSKVFLNLFFRCT